MDSFRLVGGSRTLQNDHVHACVNFLRRHPIYQQSYLVYMVENAPGSRASELQEQFRDVSRSVTMHQYGSDKRAGVPKTVDVTQRMVVRMQRALIDDAFVFAHDMATHEDTTVDAIQQKFINQLLGFRFSDKLGKLTGKETCGDDLFISAAMITLWQEVLHTDVRYAQHRKRANSDVFEYEGDLSSIRKRNIEPSDMDVDNVVATGEFRRSTKRRAGTLNEGFVY